MEYQSLINSAAGLAFTIAGWFAREMWSAVKELKSDLVTNKPEIIIDVNREKASREGISSAQVAMAVRTGLFGAEISKFRDVKDEYPIQLRLKGNSRNQTEKLLYIYHFFHFHKF